MRYLVFLISVLLCLASGSHAFGATKEITGEGRFYAQDDDNLNFVKKQLLFNAYEDIITKQLKELGLDGKLFWQQFNDQFDRSFAPVEQELKVKYLIDQDTEEAKKLSENDKRKNLEEYNKTLRIKRLTLRTRFQNLGAAITQYKVKVMNRSTQFPKSRYLKVTAKVDNKELNAIFHRLTDVSSVMQYKRLIVSSRFLLQNATWNDVGVEVSSEFEGTIADHWQKWLQNNLSTYVQEVRLATADDEKEMQEFFKLSDVAKDSAALVASENNPLYSGVLWLQLNFVIKKKSSNTLQGTRGFVFTGDYVLSDLGANRVLAYADFSRPVQNFSYEHDNKLRSAVATALYAIPLEQFGGIKDILSNGSNKLQTVLISVTNPGSMNGIFKLEKILASKGVTLQLSSQVVSLQKDRAQLKLEFSGNLPSLEALLVGLHQQEAEDVLIIVKDKNKPYELTLQQIDEVKNEP